MNTQYRLLYRMENHFNTTYIQHINCMLCESDLKTFNERINVRLNELSQKKRISMEEKKFLMNVFPLKNGVNYCSSYMSSLFKDSFLPPQTLFKVAKSIIKITIKKDKNDRV